VIATNELPERLRLETRDLHARSERSGVMAQLLGQRLSRAGYCALLRNLHAIYAALESALAGRADDPMVAALNPAPLAREGALAQDLEALHGTGWRVELALAPAAQAYVRRLLVLSGGHSPVLVAHAYVRYLGDLHGGQVLKRLVSQNLGLAAGVGTGFYDFGADARVIELRQAFRQGLARIRVSLPQADQIVAEARWAFEQHVLLFEQLAVGSGGSA